MDLKDKLLSSFLAFENNVDLNSPVHDVRSEAIKNFETKGFPSKKEEAWKYTSLNNLKKIDFSVFPKQETVLDYKEIKKYFLKWLLFIFQKIKFPKNRFKYCTMQPVMKLR